MSVTLSHYWPLLLLLALPPVWWMKAHTAVGLSARHLLASTIVRTAVIVFLTLALAQPVWNRAGKWISVVYALDISSSIDPDFVDTAIDWIAASSAGGNPTHAGYVAFGGSALSVESAEAIRSVPVSAGGADRSIDRSATNLETAVAQALRTFDPR
ncbi:MAG: VWA domain-containing protein, partial [Acidobacteria bacterium]|nr:VWA domain-containing protein [Acidobacteriota bacterium]